MVMVSAIRVSLPSEEPRMVSVRITYPPWLPPMVCATHHSNHSHDGMRGGNQMLVHVLIALINWGTHYYA
jgi:hypothetical protein